MRNLALLILVIILALFAFGEDSKADGLIISGLSYHYEDNGQYNNYNYGVHYRNSKHSYTVGVYNNSYSDWSALVTKEVWTEFRAGKFRVAPFVGMATGYRYAQVAGLMPIAGAFVEYGPVKVSVTPVVSTVSYQVVSW